MLAIFQCCPSVLKLHCQNVSFQFERRIQKTIMTMTRHFFQGEQPRPDHQRGAGLPPDDEHHLRAAVDRRPADSRAGHRLRFAC
jgi:predicted neutral ceramidase superfamily lipid hydrolase